MRRVADESIAPHAADVDAQGRFPREAVDALAQAGLLGLTIPVEYGGMGQSIRVACAALDEIAQRCASTAMIYLMHLSGCSCYIARPHAVEDTLRQVARGEHLTTLAWSEKGSRSHFWAPVNQATQNNGRIVLNAEKSWVTSASEAEGYVVSTRTAGGEEPIDTTLYLLLKEDKPTFRTPRYGLGYFMSHGTYRRYFRGIGNRGSRPPGACSRGSGPDRVSRVHRRPVRHP